MSEELSFVDALILCRAGFIQASDGNHDKLKFVGHSFAFRLAFI